MRPPWHVLTDESAEGFFHSEVKGEASFHLVEVSAGIEAHKAEEQGGDS